MISHNIRFLIVCIGVWTADSLIFIMRFCADLQVLSVLPWIPSGTDVLRSGCAAVLFRPLHGFISHQERLSFTCLDFVDLVIFP